MAQGWINQLKSNIVKDKDFLHKECVDIRDSEWEAVKSKLTKHMKIPEAVGVACNQVGFNLNGFAIDLYADKPVKVKKLMFFKNPEIEEITVNSENSFDLSSPNKIPSQRNAKQPINKLAATINFKFVFSTINK